MGRGVGPSQEVNHADSNEDVSEAARRCRDWVDWIALGLELALAVIGGFLALTIIGMVIGAPLIAASLPLLTSPKREVCA